MPIRLHARVTVVSVALLVTTPSMPAAWQSLMDPIYVCNAFGIYNPPIFDYQGGQICNQYTPRGNGGVTFPFVAPAAGEVLWVYAQVIDSAGNVSDTSPWVFIDSNGTIYTYGITFGWQKKCNQVFMLESRGVPAPSYGVVWIWSSVTKSYSYLIATAQAQYGASRSGNWCAAFGGLRP